MPKTVKLVLLSEVIGQAIRLAQVVTSQEGRGKENKDCLEKISRQMSTYPLFNGPKKKYTNVFLLADESHPFHAITKAMRKLQPLCYL